MPATAPLKELYPVIERVRKGAHLQGRADYERLWRRSVEDPAAFWGEQARAFLTWRRPFDRVLDCDFKTGLSSWFLGGQLNVSENCIDRHLEKRADQTAILWEGDDPSQVRTVTYRQLHHAVCQLANALLARGITRGSRVAIYLPMIPEAAFAMLACARIGATHSVVFGGFSAEALKDRILDAGCCALITADEGLRGKKPVPLKKTADEALAHCPDVHTVLVARRTGAQVPMKPGRDIPLDEAMAREKPYCPAQAMDSEDPLFLLYTSGSTGKPKGIQHTTAGYLLFAAITHKYVFDYREGDIYCCAADVGWVTGHSYVVYGPLCNGATTVMSNT